MNRILHIPDSDKVRLKVMFLAKHALAQGEPDPADGNHAIYHHEASLISAPRRSSAASATTSI